MSTETRDIRTIQQRQIAASTYHASEALALLTDSDSGEPGSARNLDRLAAAQVHATLSHAAATRALVVL